MVDDTRAKACQSVYILTRSDIALGELHKECVAIARNMVEHITWTTKYTMSPDRAMQIAQDGAVNLMEYYLKKRDYVVRFFNKRMQHIIREILYSKYGRHANDNRWEQHNIQLDDEHNEIACKEEEEKLDLTYALEDILSEHPDGKRIVIDIYRARTYKSAILTINKYVSKRWIYDRAEKLYRVYKYTRR
jgi:hypothetical protein